MTRIPLQDRPTWPPRRPCALGPPFIARVSLIMSTGARGTAGRFGNGLRTHTCPKATVICGRWEKYDLARQWGKWFQGCRKTGFSGAVAVCPSRDRCRAAATEEGIGAGGRHGLHISRVVGASEKRMGRINERNMDNAVWLQLHALAYNLANFMQTLSLPKEVAHWSLITRRA